MTYRFRFTDNLPSHMNDVPEVVRAFFPYVEIADDADDVLSVDVEELNGAVNIKLGGNVVKNDVSVTNIDGMPGELVYKRLAKRSVKQKLYLALSNLTGVNLPYGSLTGVRPTRLYYDAIGSYSNVKQHLIDDFFVEEKRAELVENVVETQKDIYNFSGEGIDVFVNIPICPTRCKYCSFISTEYPRVRKLVPQYVSCVARELEEISKKIADENLKVRSVYYGGGTPTSISAEELGSLLKLTSYGCEFTVEAGRPDSITREKLAVMEKHDVTRISVNPQTFKDETLRILGRRHTTEDLYRAFSLAREFDFDINMDLIAGLPGEKFEDFKLSLEKSIELSPENITVHTLSLKRGSILKEEGARKNMDGSIREMVDYSIDRLKNEGYRPYYMYRQKNMADGLENVGWCKPGKACVYNVDYMEETNSVLSAGAGAMSKFVYKSEGRIERQCNAKGFEEYLRRKSQS